MPRCSKKLREGWKVFGSPFLRLNHCKQRFTLGWHRKFGVETVDGIGSTEALHIYVSARPGEVNFTNRRSVHLAYSIPREELA
jgi:hypothetical protein